MYWAYHTLGVTPGASKVEVKKQYRKLLMAYHPDRLLHTRLSDDKKKAILQKFHEVQRAWEALEKAFQQVESGEKERAA